MHTRAHMLLSVLLLFVTNGADSISINNTGCGSTKTCTALSSSCLSGTLDGCSGFVAWRGVTVGGVNYLEVELYSSGGGSNAWVGFCLSTDTGMAGNPFEACEAKSGGGVSVKYGRFVAKSFPGYSSSPAAASFLTTSGGDLGLQYSSGVLQCRYRRQLLSSDTTVGLQTSTPYYTLIAKGVLSSGETGLSYHGGSKTASSSTSSITFASAGGTSAATTTPAAAMTTRNNVQGGFAQKKDILFVVVAGLYAMHALAP